MTEDTPVVEIEDIYVIESNGNVIPFNSKKNPNNSEDNSKFDFNEFLIKVQDQKDEIEDFVFIGIRKDGQTSVSVKVESNLYLYWIIKRFLRHLEGILFD